MQNQLKKNIHEIKSMEIDNLDLKYAILNGFLASATSIQLLKDGIDSDNK